MANSGNYKAAAGFVNSKTLVLWDMDTCRVPNGYDARRVRPSIESALKSLGYLGPVTISALGNLENTSAQLLQGLSSTGVAVTHCLSEMVRTEILDDISSFKSANPPPATIMIISDKVEKEIAPFLCRSQQYSSGYDVLVASTYRSVMWSPLVTTAKWLWFCILFEFKDDQQETRSGYVLQKCSESGESTPFFCRSCEFTALTATNLTCHLSTKKHKRKESIIVESRKPDPGDDDEDEHPKGKIEYWNPPRRRLIGFRKYHALLLTKRTNKKA